MNRATFTFVADEDDDAPPLRPKVKRQVNAKMRRAFDDLDPIVHARKLEVRHRRQRFIRFLRINARRCASCGGPMGAPPELPPGKKKPVTCERCLRVDSAYKKSSVETRAIAKWKDEHGRPMVLAFTPRMLPVFGQRYDGDEPGWPECANLSACELELVKACAPKDAPGMSCPKDCAARRAVR